ncbi:Hypothetical predicted protein [Olea europaea subsp. europaea]|uniref:Uncharacterized protein n=1 Tax=Olea europaea subsp. europaea TaxID=158383 RepID=A0A8S0RQC0_OLEEU|nr:Hypothetical predicted protein [Olea europaea subsp. europaea]
MAEREEMAESKLSLTLLIDPKIERVLFVEAGKDTVDFIFHILSLPVASVIKLVGQQEMVGCLGNLCKSAENLNATYIQQGKNKEIILNPKAPNWTASIPLLLLDKPNAPTCNSFSPGTIAEVNVVSYSCAPVENYSNEGGFVKRVTNYMVTDDLVVKPLSAMSTIDSLNKFNVKELGESPEKEVDIGMNEEMLNCRGFFFDDEFLFLVEAEKYLIAEARVFIIIEIDFKPRQEVVESPGLFS